MGKSILQKAWEQFRQSDPGWSAEVIPIAGTTDVAICATKVDTYVNRKMYGSVFARYKSRKAAEKAVVVLNRMKANTENTKI